MELKKGRKKWNEKNGKKDTHPVVPKIKWLVYETGLSCFAATILYSDQY